MQRITFAALGGMMSVVLMAGIAPRAEGQNLGPFRQFLSVEPYYAFERLDVGDAGRSAGAASGSSLNLQGFGARLWLNSAPFGLTDHLGVGLFYTYTPTQQDRGATIMHYGGQLEIFPVHRPLGNVLDPFITVGAGAFRLNTFGGEAGISRGAVTRLSVLPGVGLRIPIPNRFQIRIDARDAIIFNSDVGTAPGETRTAHNLEATASLGLTF